MRIAWLQVLIALVLGAFLGKRFGHLAGSNNNANAQSNY